MKNPAGDARAFAAESRGCWLVAAAVLVGGCSMNRSMGERAASAQNAAPPGTTSDPSAANNSAEVVEILEKHIAAIGGRDAQTAIKTVVTEREAEVFQVVRKMYEIRDKTTQRFYSKTEDPNGTFESGFDGKRAWQRSPFFKGYLAESDPNAKTLSRRPPELYSYKESGQKFVRSPDETVDRQQLIVLQTTSRDLDPLSREIPVKYYFHPESFLLRRMVIGAEVTQTTDFDDYREVEGTKVAFAVTTTSPNLTFSLKTRSIHYNIPVEPAIFEYQPSTTSDAGSSPGADKTSELSTTKAAVPVVVAQDDDRLTEKVRVDTFELVWSTVNDSYSDATFGGVDWKAVHDKYLPRIKATERSAPYHQLLNDMLGELDRSHLRITPPDRVQGLHSQGSTLRNGSVGLDLRWLDGELVVFDTKREFPADRAGIKRGFRIARINGRDVDQLLADYRKKRGGFPLREQIERVRAAVDELTGAANTEVTLEIVDQGGQTRVLKLNRRARPASPAPEFESRTLENNIGYVRFSMFFGDVLTKTTHALRQWRDTAGLIIDLRGNLGGAGDLTGAIASLLSAQPGTLGSSSSRYGERQNAYPGSGPDAYLRPVVVLVDEMTGSAAEVFSGGLQANHRATVVGATTAGAVLPSLMKLLPTGAALLHAVGDFRTSNGTVLEGRGVIPDIQVKPSRRSWLEGRDPSLEKAIDFLTSAKRIEGYK